MSRKAEIQKLVYPIVDAFQFTLNVDPVDQTIHGSEAFTVSLNSSEPDGLKSDVELAFHTTVIGGYVGKVTASVLVHVMGNLYLFSYYRHDTEKVHMVLVDMAKYKNSAKIDKLVKNKASLIMKQLKPAIVGHYMRGVDDAKWEDYKQEKEQKIGVDSTY